MQPMDNTHEQSLIILILYVSIWIFVGFLLSKIWFQAHIKRLQKKSVHQSKRVTLWYVQEKIAPLLPDFPYHMKDLVFLGKWVDYIVFEWLHNGYVDNIVFLEIKTGKSTLSTNEKAIKQAIDHHRVKYEILRYT
jgi:predicted Holliday junction resolvase-like endonuclease